MQDVTPRCHSLPSLEQSSSSMKIIEVFGLMELRVRLMIMSCLDGMFACDAWKLQVSQVNAADLLISSCHKSIIF